MTFYNPSNVCGVVYPYLVLIGPPTPYTIGGENLTIYRVGGDAYVIPSHLKVRTSVEFVIDRYRLSIYPGVYKVHIEIYNATFGSGYEALIAEYDFNDMYIIELYGDSYIQTGEINIGNTSYPFIYLHIETKDIRNWKNFTYYDIGKTLYNTWRYFIENYDINIPFLHSLSTSLMLLDEALGPYPMEIDNTYGVGFTILFSNNKGYLINKSPIDIYRLDIFSDSLYIYRDGLEDLGYSYITLHDFGDFKSSFLRIILNNTDDLEVAVRYGGEYIGVYNDEIRYMHNGSIYYKLDGEIIIVLPYKVDSFCIVINASKLESESIELTIDLRSVLNDKTIDMKSYVETIRKGEDKEICIDNVNGVFRARITNKGIGLLPIFSLELWVMIIILVVILSIAIYYISKKMQR